MTYSVKELYFTLQGEGANTGRPAVFMRFAGCNLWTGREEDRATAVCRFCDTDFVGTDGVGGGTYRTATDLADVAHRTWLQGPEVGGLSRRGSPFCVLTGGEPLLQVDDSLIDALHRRGFAIAIETNGTIAAPDALDWVCVSPKAGVCLVQQCGDELKIVYPQEGIDPSDHVHLDFTHFFLQPMDGPAREANTAAAVAYCAAHPMWKVSLQTHKLIGIP